ncbi:unnamed protein product [Cuscuta europaea]|uniref:Uncharacterized protein n=1 Tax=Cuscuta europaea TaxID=41803 RepID=A0A9P1EEP4_CUSEU|nr:unnamed protein product [Cuscuta europaea]
MIRPGQKRDKFDEVKTMVEGAVQRLSYVQADVNTIKTVLENEVKARKRCRKLVVIGLAVFLCFATNMYSSYHS